MSLGAALECLRLNSVVLTAGPVVGGWGHGAEGEERESILLPRAWGRRRGNARSGGDLLCDLRRSLSLPDPLGTTFV